MGLILHLVESQKLKLKNGGLYVETEEKETYLDIDEFDAIVIDTTRISLTSSAILYAVEHKVPIILCNNKHLPQAFCFDIYMHYKTSERIQMQISWSEEKKQELWREIVKEKINGQRNNIMSLDKDRKVYDTLSIYIEMLEDDFENLETQTINTQEAVSARLYFKEMFGKNFVRQNEDVTNYALNYGYSLLRSYISCMITAKGLHPSLGVSHHNMFNNYNLADDIIEVFRPMVDLMVHRQLEYHTEFTKEFRGEMLEVLTSEVIYKDREVCLKRCINLFLDNILDFFEKDITLEIPKLEVAYATV